MRPIGITLGDANGIGPEVLLKAFIQGQLPKDVLVIGDLNAIIFAQKALNLNCPIQVCPTTEEFQPEKLNVLDTRQLKTTNIQPSVVCPIVGQAALHAVHVATEMCLHKQLKAMVTLPINKAAIQQSMPDFQGHTDYIANLCNAKHYAMAYVVPTLVVALVSAHVALKTALELVQQPRIEQVIKLLHPALANLGRGQKIGVCGLNPHAGEQGAFGTEEIKQITPAIQSAVQQGFNVVGPLPPDTIFVQAKDYKLAAVVAMYHDQGLIPAKLLGFETGVNLSLGLNIVRTSVGHGTAFDIAYQNKANPHSLVEALHIAEQLAD